MSDREAFNRYCHNWFDDECEMQLAWLAWQAATLAERERCAAEVKKEPELDDEMPDEMFEYMTRGRAEMTEALRAVVRATKGEILDRVNRGPIPQEPAP